MTPPEPPKVRNLRLVGERIEGLGHRLHELFGPCPDEALPVVEVLDRELEAAERLDEGGPALEEGRPT